MHTRTSHRAHTHRRTILALIFGLAFSATLAYAVPPLTKYNPGDTLDPNCAPGDSNCSILLPSGGTSQWDDVTGGINYAGGNVGIGTTTPSAALDVVGEIRGSNLTITGDATTVGAPTGLTATQTCADACNYIADGSSGSPHNYRVYAYKNTGIGRIYSSTYATLVSDFTDDGSNANYDISVSWSSVSGADGYRVLVYDPNYNGYSYDAGYDTTSTSFIDDGCGNVCFDGGLTSVTPTSAYSNISTINGGVQIYGSISIQGNISSINGISYTFPNSQAANGQVLSNDGAGLLSWVNLPAVSPITIQNTNSLISTGITGAGVNSTAQRSIFLGVNAGYDATNATDSIFLGRDAGYGATDSRYSNFLGWKSGENASNAVGSNFIGVYAGRNATSAIGSNFFGSNAGENASNAISSNFFGQTAGTNATNAENSNFFGNTTGSGAENANNSNFFGWSAGYNAVNANNSNFFGRDAGYGATDASYSNIFGYQAGKNSFYANDSNFFGQQSGFDAPNANNSNFFGKYAGNGGTNASDANFFGYGAGSSAVNANNSIFIGRNTGENAQNAAYSFFAGTNSGHQASNAANSIFLGSNSGSLQEDSITLDNTAAYNDITTFANTSILIGHRTSTGGFSNSIALGAYAVNTTTNQLVIGSEQRSINSVFIGGGQGTASTDNGIFIGQNAAKNAFGASGAIFIGSNAGSLAIGANNSVFFGVNSGEGAQFASDSNFIGLQAGTNAVNASNANFFGAGAGVNATNADQSIFIGSNVANTATNAANSIFLGQKAGLNDTVNNTAIYDDITTFANTSILIGHRTSTGGFSNSIALGAYAVNTGANQFMIGSSTRPINTTRINGSASTQCTITSGTGIACTSDERLKTNISDLSGDTLSKLLSVRTITYNWLQNPDSPSQIGFLAQDLQQYFPELVATDSDGYKSVYYAQMTPILTEAIREMNSKIVNIANLDTENSWRSSLLAWFGDLGNGIQNIFSKKVTTEQICVRDGEGETCVTRGELNRLLGQSGQQSAQVTTEAPASPAADSPSDPAPTTSDESIEATVASQETQTPSVESAPTAPEIPETTESTQEVTSGQ